MHLLYPARSGSSRRKRIVYGVSFLASVYLALPLYIASTFLGAYVPEKEVGLVFTGSALAGIGLLAALPSLLNAMGNYRALLLFLMAGATGLIAVILSSMPVLVVSAFFLYLAATYMLPVQLDIFLEDASQDATTGNTRGAYLTASNLGVLAAPLVAGFLLARNDFRLVFFLTALLAVPLSFLVVRGFKNFKDPGYERAPLSAAFEEIGKNRSLLGVYLLNFLLYFFYSWMIIYMPIYLNRHVGFSWNAIGVIFTVMLAPFVLFELPLGRLADKKWGEKEILIIGILIMALASASLSFIVGPVVWLWAIALFVTRIGASFVEIASETYFFKYINSTDAHLISIFRMTRPVGHVVGPVMATILLSFIDIRFLFLALGIIMLAGLPASMILKDTK